MSYAAFGQQEGYAPPTSCDEYIVRADGRCADTGGVRLLSWYNIRTGRCEEPPPIPCEVNAPNLPAACPAGQILNSAVPQGCSPAPGGGAPAANGDMVSPPTEPPQRAGFDLGAAIRNQPVAAAFLVGGTLLIAAALSSR